MVHLQNPTTGAATADFDAELDSGAEYSLFDGDLLATVGMDLFSGDRFVFSFANGVALDARIFQVVISHANLGSFNLLARFSTGPLRTNILGRDFFDLLQVGFDEHHSEIHLNVPR